jgi:hypothetical protein
MKRSPEPDPVPERPNLDFRKNVRGKYYDRAKQGTNIAIISPDLLDTFLDSEAVNEALRSLRRSRNGRGSGRRRLATLSETHISEARCGAPDCE